MKDARSVNPSSEIKTNALKAAKESISIQQAIGD
jgi:hypothetical protein